MSGIRPPFLILLYWSCNRDATEDAPTEYSGVSQAWIPTSTADEGDGGGAGPGCEARMQGEFGVGPSVELCHIEYDPPGTEFAVDQIWLL